MTTWSAPQRPNAYAEQTLIEAILEGTFPPGSTLPGERTLAEQMGITRPTLREAIQRLARDGWLTVRQGKATEVNNFWQQGGLNVLSALAQHSRHLPPNFITQLLEVRLHLAPAYTKEAVEHNPQEIQKFLSGSPAPTESIDAYAAFDWELHRKLTISSENPIYTLILNGFEDSYEHFARMYFSASGAREQSRGYYDALAEAARKGDPELAETISYAAMVDSIALWKTIKSWGE